MAEKFISVPILVLKIFTFSCFVYIILFLIKLKTNGMEYVQTVTNTTEMFIPIKIYFHKSDYFKKNKIFMTVPLNLIFQPMINCPKPFFECLSN